MWIDSHCHLADDTLFNQADVHIQEALEACVEHLVVIATDPATLHRALELKSRWDCVSVVASITPHEAHEITQQQWEEIEYEAKAGKLVAIGETGLEYFYGKEFAKQQKDLCHRYFQLAQDLDLPVVIHCREAFQDLFQILDAYPKIRGVLHCFTGTLEEAQELMARNFLISLSGIVTYKKSRQLQQVATALPSKMLLVETDAPYLAPQVIRGRQNSPKFVASVGEFVADLRGESSLTFAKQTSENARNLFRLSASNPSLL